MVEQTELITGLVDFVVYISIYFNRIACSSFRTEFDFRLSSNCNLVP